jgi:uncharacterized Tic20 family protein
MGEKSVAHECGGGPVVRSVAMAIGEPVQADAATGEATTSQQRSQASMAHALALLGLVIPFANILAPLIMWVNDQGPGTFVKDHARESLNFQITMIIASMINLVLCFVLIGFALLCVQYVFTLVVVIQATMAANQGRTYLYPLTIRLLK